MYKTLLNLKYYWFLILLILITWFRLDLSCFNNKCSIDENKMYSFINFNVFNNIREHSIKVINQNFPSPNSELLLGMTIGIDNLSSIPSFKQALKNTGTIHVVVVSGFNISLVFNTVLTFLKSRYLLKNLIIAQIVTILYCIITGLEPPIVRALIMGSVINWASYLGRGLNTLLVIFTSVFFITAIEPLYLFSLSFILSTMATIGLVIYSPIITGFLGRYINENNLFLQDFTAGLSATLLVWPIISYFFGSLSIISLLVNTLILWSVSFTTILGTIFILISFFSYHVANLLTIPLYVLTDVFVQGVYFFNNLNVGYYNLTISLNFLAIYYFLVFVATFIYTVKNPLDFKNEQQFESDKKGGVMEESKLKAPSYE